MNAQPKLMSPHWQRKSPSELQQQLKDKHDAAAQRRNLQQVQKKARQARAQAGREASSNKTCWLCPLLCSVSQAAFAYMCKSTAWLTNEKNKHVEMQGCLTHLAAL